MLSAAVGFAVLDSLIKLLGPSYRVWDIAFYRWGIGFVLLLIILFCHRKPGPLGQVRDNRLCHLSKLYVVSGVRFSAGGGSVKNES